MIIVHLMIAGEYEGPLAVGFLTSSRDVIDVNAYFRLWQPETRKRNVSLQFDPLSMQIDNPAVVDGPNSKAGAGVVHGGDRALHART